MQAAEFQAAGINLTLVAWLARHAKDVPAIVTGVQNVAAAVTLDEKWSAAKAVGDVIVADLRDFPGAPTPPVPQPSDPVIGPVTTPVAEVDAALSAIGDGHVINAIVSLLTNPQTLAIIELILKLAGIAL